MYDVTLRNDLINLKQMVNATDGDYRYVEMKQLIKCKTKDKISLINFLLSYHLVDDECYRELLQRTESDYKRANLYLVGLCNI